MDEEYLTLNRAVWDERAPLHAASSDYALARYDDPAYLSGVVTFDLPRLGDVRGRDGVHLQCHIGTDTISLARLGARMHGLDFSGASIAEARRLGERADTRVTFHEGNVYDAVDVLGAAGFDFVYTGVGALCWLPDMGRWARVVASLLRPGGRLFLREAHPMLWSLDEKRTDGLHITYPYFARAEPIVIVSDETYVQTDSKMANTTTHQWNHGLGQIVTALLEAGLVLTQLVEHDSVPWNALPGQMEELAHEEWRLKHVPDRLAHSYTLQAIKPA